MDDALRRCLPAGRFDVVRRLGQGGQGVVHEAIDLQTGERVAIKSALVRNADALYALKSEFRALAQVDLPQIARYRDLFVDGLDCAFSMEFVQGIDVLTWVAGWDSPAVSGFGDDGGATRPAPNPHPEGLDLRYERRLRQLLSRLLTSLEALHGAGWVHCDVKPGNLLVDDVGSVRLLDFGLAQHLSRRGEDDRAARPFGTPGYMAPEQAAGETPQPAWDLYAAGCVLFKGLTGRLPFLGPRRDVLRRKRTSPAPTADAFIRGLPSDLVELAARLLSVDPADRPSAPLAAAIARGEAEVETVDFSGDSSSSLRSADPPRLIGRESELARLEAAFEVHRAGGTVLVSVEGESGIGKTRLVRDFLQSVANDRSNLTLRGRSYPDEDVPFKALDELVDGLARSIASGRHGSAERLIPRRVGALLELFPVLGRVRAFRASAEAESLITVGPQQRRRHGFDAFDELLARLSDRGAVVLWLDDFQWSDHDSEELLLHLFAKRSPTPLMLVLTSRPESAGRDLLVGHVLAQGGAAERMPLGPLDLPALDELLRSMELDGVDSGALQQASGGNPLLALELAGARGDASASGVGEGLSDLLERRMRRLPQRARRLVELTCISGRPLAWGLLVQAGSLRGAQRGMRDHLVREGLLRRVDVATNTVVIRHDRIREALVDRMAPAVSSAHAGALASVLERGSHAEPELLSRLWEAAGSVRPAMLHALEAARRARRALAFDQAVNLFRRTLDLDRRAELPEVFQALAEAQSLAGRAGESADTWLEAARRASPREAFVCRRHAALQYIYAGHRRRGLGLLGELLAERRIRLPKGHLGTLGSMLWWRFRLRWSPPRPARQITSGDLDALDLSADAANALGFVDGASAAGLQHRVLFESLRVGEPTRLARAYTATAAYAAATGRGTARARRLLAHAESLASRHPDVSIEVSLEVLRLLIDFYEGRLDSVLARSRTLELRSDVEPWALLQVRRYVMWALTNSGDWRALGGVLEGELQRARDLGNLGMEALIRISGAISTGMAADRPQQTRADALEALQAWSPEPRGMYRVLGVGGQARLDLYEGDAWACWTRLDTSWRDLVRSGLLWVREWRVEFLFLRGRSAAGAARQVPEEAANLRRDAERCARQLDRLGSMRGALFATLVRACSAAERGAGEAASLLLREAASDLESRGLLLHAACGAFYIAATDAERQQARARLEALGMANPARIAFMMLPGFEGPPSAPELPAQ